MIDHSTTGRRKSDRAGTIARLSLRTGPLSWTSLTALVVCLGMLAAGAIAYYQYINNREAFLTRQAFRSLDELGQNVSGATKAYLKTLEPFASKAEKLLKASRNRPFDPKSTPSPEDVRCLTQDPVDLREKVKVDEAELVKKHFRLLLSSLCTTDKLIDVQMVVDTPQLQSLPVQSSPHVKESEAIKLALAGGYRLDSLKEEALQFQAPHRPKATTYQIIPETDDTRSLQLELKQEIPSTALGLGAKNPWTTVRVTARFRLDPLLEELPIPETFTDVIIADESGRVILHRPDPTRAATTNFERLDSLLQQTLQEADKPSFPSNSEAKSTSNGAASLLARLPAQRSVKLGDSDYYVFAQALTIDIREEASVTLSDETQPAKLILVGLVSADELRWSAMKISHSIALGLILFVFVLTFSLPLIKLKSMGPRDRLGLPDALICMLFSIMGTALFTLAFGAWVTHNAISDSADNQLEYGSKGIQRQFENEFEKVIQKLAQLQGKEWEPLATLCPPSQSSAVRWQLEKGKSIILPPQSGCRGGSGLDSTDPFLVHTALWIRPDGEVARVETIQRQPIVTPNLKERSYLRDIWQGTHLHQIEIDHSFKFALQIKPIQSKWTPIVTPKPSLKFAIQPVYTWSDGDFSTMIATKAISLPNVILDDLRFNPENRGDHVVAIRVPLRALTGTVVPIGYGYSVIDKTGLVLYDSDKRNNLRENLFRATDDNQELKSLVSSGAKAKVRATYRGHSHTMYVAPLLKHALPWTLVVYRDTQWLDWVTDESLFFAVAVFSMYAFVFIVIGLFVFVLYASIASGSGGWMWPCQKSVGSYWILSLINVVGTGLLLWIAGKWIDDYPLFAIFLSVTGVCILTYIVIYVLNSKLLETRTASLQLSQNSYPPNSLSRDVRWAYSCMATTMIFVLAVIPASTFFTIGVHRSLSLYESYAGYTITERADSCRNAWVAWRQRVLLVEQPDHYSNLRANTEEFDHPFCSKAVLPKLVNQLNITNWSGAWLNDKHRLRLHLWMWEPGRQLGGWIGHAPTDNHQPFSSILFKQELAWSCHLIASILAIVMVLGIAGLFELGPAYKDKIILALLFIAVCMIGISVFPGGDVSRSKYPSSEWDRTLFLMYMGFGAGIVTMITYGTQRIVSHYLFLLDFQEPIILNEQPTSTSHKHVLIVIPSIHWFAWSGKQLKMIGNDSSSIGWHVYDIPQHIQNIPGGEGAAEYLPLPKDNGALALTGFDFRITEPRQAYTMLQFMERLALEPDRPVLLIAQRHPFDPELMSFESTEAPVQGRMTQVNRERWAHALRNFLVVPFSGREYQGAHEDVVKEILADPAYLTGKKPTGKCRDWKDVVEDVQKDQNHGNYARMRYALGMMRCHYEYWWAECTKSEKLALAQIASDHFLHAGNPKLYSVIWKGFVTLKPHLQLLNQSFRTFILQVADRDDIHHLEYDLRPSIWAKASGPLIIGLISFVLFLGITQESVRDVIIAFAPILPAFLLELPKLFGGWGRTTLPKLE